MLYPGCNMLKRKIEIGYRKAIRATDKQRRCGNCANRVWADIYACSGGEVVGQGWRCKVIGVQNSRKYSVAEDHICDHFTAKKETA